MKKSPINKVSKKTIAQLKKKLWKLFSVYIRQKGMDDQGINTCYTCKQKYHWKKLQAGHFNSRTHNSTFVDEINVKAQCFACNIWKRGNSALFAEHLIEEHGL